MPHCCHLVASVDSYSVQTFAPGGTCSHLMYIFFSPSCYFFHFNKLHCCCCFFTYSSFPHAILHTNHWTTVPLILLNPFFGEICVIKKASELLQTIPFLNFIIYHFYLNNFTDNFNWLFWHHSRRLSGACDQIYFFRCRYLPIFFPTYLNYDEFIV